MHVAGHPRFSQAHRLSVRDRGTEMARVPFRQFLDSLNSVPNVLIARLSLNMNALALAARELLSQSRTTCSLWIPLPTQQPAESELGLKASICSATTSPIRQLLVSKLIASFTVCICPQRQRILLSGLIPRLFR